MNTTQQEIENILTEIFGSDWGLIETIDEKPPCIQYAIYIDQIELTNSQNFKHTIKGLFMIFRFTPHYELIGLYGLRSYLSFNENAAGYLHSHLPARGSRTDQCEPHVFCLGQTPLRDAVNALCVFDSATFRKACGLLYTLAGWESLEGVPYIRVSSIYGHTYESDNRVSNILTAVQRDIKKHSTWFTIDTVNITTTGLLCTLTATVDFLKEAAKVIKKEQTEYLLDDGSRVPYEVQRSEEVYNTSTYRLGTYKGNPLNLIIETSLVSGGVIVPNPLYEHYPLVIPRVLENQVMVSINTLINNAITSKIIDYTNEKLRNI